MALKSNKPCICYGHESLSGAYMGETIECDGSCNTNHIFIKGYGKSAECEECGLVIAYA